MDTIRMAIIGAGVWGETHAAIFREHPAALPVAICDKDKPKAEALAEKYGIPRVFGSVDELLGWGEFDAVSIVTPDHLHGDIAVACANAGMHMLIEKPLATSREDVTRILEAVRANRVRAMVDLHNRWSPPFAAAHDAVQRGELGTLRSAYFRLNDIKWVATDMLPWAASSSIMWFLGSHSFDTLQWVFGDKARRVYTVSNRGVLDALGVPTEDVFLTTIEFAHGGIAQMENGWITPNANPCVNDIKCNLLGDKGMIAIDASNHNLIQFYSDETRCTVMSRASRTRASAPSWTASPPASPSSSAWRMPPTPASPSSPCSNPRRGACRSTWSPSALRRTGDHSRKPICR